MPRVVHFEIHADDPDRAMAFYGNALGWEFKRWEGPEDYWIIRTGPKAEEGIDGGLFRRKGPAPIDHLAVNAYVCTISVSDLEEYLHRVSRSGGKIVVPKKAIPGVGWLAYAKDPEGNIFGLMQNDPLAE